MQREYLAALTAVIAGLVLLSVGAFAAFGSAGAAEPAENASTDDHTIHVSATGEAETAPDQAVLAVAVTADGEEIGTVRDQIATGADELTAALDELGVEYETTDYEIEQPRRPHDERESPAYAGSHSFEITLEDPDRVGTVIDEAVDAGAEIEHVRLTLSQERRDDLRSDAIEDAMVDARQQADTIAATSDLTVQTVSSVDASQRSYSPVAFDSPAMAVEDGADGAPPTDIATGDVTVSYSVDVTYDATGI